MLKQLFLLIITFLSLEVNAQVADGYTLLEDGLNYKIIKEGKGEFLKSGQFFEVHFNSILSRIGGDTILNNSRDLGTPQIIQLDTATLPKSYFTILSKVKNGDSIVTKTLVNNMFKKNPESMPAFIKLGDFLYTNLRVINIYKTKAEADKAIKENLERAEIITKLKADSLVLKDDNILKEFLSTNNILAIKSPKGSYIQILKEGEGAQLDNKQFVKINYTGKTLDGNMFDSNIDSSKGHVEPLLVNLTEDTNLGNGVISGMTDAILMMKKGTKAIIYIPSGLAYGPRGAGNEIPPNANLIFEVEVLSTKTLDQFKAEKSKKEKELLISQVKKAITKVPKKELERIITNTKKIVSKKSNSKKAKKK